MYKSPHIKGKTVKQNTKQQQTRKLSTTKTKQKLKPFKTRQQTSNSISSRQFVTIPKNHTSFTLTHHHHHQQQNVNNNTHLHFLTPISKKQFSTMNTGRNHDELTNNLVKNGLLSTPAIINAWRKADRKYFNPLRDVNIYEDRPWPIGAEATISAPNVHSVGAQAVSDNLFSTQLDPKTNQQYIPKRSILDVASGSGYMTALFGTICKDTLRNGSTVLGIDIHQSLVDQSIINTNNFDPDLLSKGYVSYMRADAFRPTAPFPGAPYDVIHAGCAIQFVPLSVLSMLKPNGSMIIPIQINAQTNDQNFYHIRRRELSFDQLPTDSPYAGKIKNDTDFFNVATQIQNRNNSREVNDFLNTFFHYKSLFGCIYLLALDDNNAPQHINAWPVPQ